MTWLDSILRKEYASTDIFIQTVCPMLVQTKMTARLNHGFPQFTIVTPQTFAKQAVRSIGLVNETTGCIFHQLLYAIVYKWIPDVLLNMFIYYRNNTLKKQFRSNAGKKDS
jgi:short-subunit dehydrogenase